jgi:hypothetical protein
MRVRRIAAQRVFDDSLPAFRCGRAAAPALIARG